MDITFDCTNIANVGGRIVCKSGSQVLVLSNCCDSGPKGQVTISHNLSAPLNRLLENQVSLSPVVVV